MPRTLRPASTHRSPSRTPEQLQMGSDLRFTRFRRGNRRRDPIDLPHRCRRPLDVSAVSLRRRGRAEWRLWILEYPVTNQQRVERCDSKGALASAPAGPAASRPPRVADAAKTALAPCGTVSRVGTSDGAWYESHPMELIRRTCRAPRRRPAARADAGASLIAKARTLGPALLRRSPTRRR